MWMLDTTTMKLVKYMLKLSLRNAHLDTFARQVQFQCLMSHVLQARTSAQLVLQHASLARLVTTAWVLRSTPFHALLATIVVAVLLSLHLVLLVPLVLLRSCKHQEHALLARKDLTVLSLVPMHLQVSVIKVTIVLLAKPCQSRLRTHAQLVAIARLAASKVPRVPLVHTTLTQRPKHLLIALNVPLDNIVTEPQLHQPLVLALRATGVLPAVAFQTNM
jgi:hypothetical protein